MRHYDIKIFGRVQGVGFRSAALVEAKVMRLHGFVKNGEDGSVIIEAEGDEKKLEEFLAWCRLGPLWSKVEKVEFEIKIALKNYENFEIL
jgi:acylphosphatase